jgi:chromosome segregation ATPase
MVWNKQSNPVPVWHDEPDVKQNKEKRMLWKNKSDYARECESLRRELRNMEIDLKDVKGDYNAAMTELRACQNQMQLNVEAHSFAVKKLKSELDRALDGTELLDLKKKYETTATDLKGAKEFITKLEGQCIYHDLEVTAQKRYTDNLQAEIAALKERVELLTKELNTVDGLAMTKELVTIIRSLKDDESGMLDKVVNALVKKV